MAFAAASDSAHPFTLSMTAQEADEIFTRRHLLFASSIIASSASAEAGGETYRQYGNSAGSAEPEVAKTRTISGA